MSEHHEAMEQVGTHLPEINLRVCAHASLANEVHNPLLALVTGKVEAFRKIALPQL